jgi:hypothetical protein
MSKAAICHLCRDEVAKPWIIDGWKPVCKTCFDSFRGVPGVEVVKVPKRGGPPDTQKKAEEPQRVVDVAAVSLPPLPEPGPQSYVDALSPDDEPYIILYPEDLPLTNVLPEDCMVLPGQPEAWRKQWDNSKLKRLLDTEKEWFPEADEPGPDPEA